MLKRTSNVNIQRRLLAFFTINNKYNNGVFLSTIALAVALASSISISLNSLNAHAQAQEYNTTTATTSDQKTAFNVVVQVTNNANVNETGTIHVFINDTNISKVLNGVVLPAKSTVEYAFEFDEEDVPVGKGFTAEMVYGDDVFKRAYGVNSPSKAPEIAQLTIP